MSSEGTGPYMIPRPGPSSKAKSQEFSVNHLTFPTRITPAGQYITRSRNKSTLRTPSDSDSDLR